jgi:SNF2 family DNA or RNA helicase
MNSISIWKNKIILNWDGRLPPGTDPATVHSPEDVPYIWEHLDGFAKFSKRANAYVLSLSLQNFHRLERQFGKLSASGQEQISSLKKEQARIDGMVALSRKIKELPLERLPSYVYKLAPLAEYQHRGVVFLKNIRRAPLFADCGLGKSYMVLVSTEQHINDGVTERGKTLIVAKLATLETGWLEDAEKFTNLRVTSLWLPQGSKRKEKIRALLAEPADVYLINHDGLRVFKDELKAMNFQKVVVDESTILKGFHGLNPQIKGGQFGRALFEVAHAADWRVVMSGTPAPNGPQDMWGQIYFLDPTGILLEPSYSDFQHSFMKLVDLRPKAERTRPMDHKTPRKWIPKVDGVKRAGDLVNPLAYRVRIRDHLTDLPPLTTIRRLITMDEEQARQYKEMEERLRVVIDDTRITVPVKLAQLMKLRQITGGFIIDNQEMAHALPTNPKLAELDSIIEDEIGPEHKTIIYGQYRWEIGLLETRYKHRNAVSVYGGNSSQKNLANIKSFIHDPSIGVIVLHPKSAGHGLNLTCAHYMVFYSVDHSAEDNYQSIKRIERAGQKHPMFVYFLLCKNSIDMPIYEVIALKKKNQEALIDPDQLLLNMLGAR